MNKNTETDREKAREVARDIRKTVTESIEGKLKDLDSVRGTLTLISETLESEEAKADIDKVLEVLLYYKAGVADAFRLADFNLEIEAEF